ncbi:MAG: Oligopeptide transport system permease protein OppB, partial [uncultured Thermomicrobiales bacterium]
FDHPRQSPRRHRERGDRPPHQARGM